MDRWIFCELLSRTLVGKNYSLLKFDLGAHKLMQRVQRGSLVPPNNFIFRFATIPLDLV
jgi:hypothetical protein